MKQDKNVLLFLSQGFEEYEAAVFTDVIGWSRVVGVEPVGLKTTGLRKEVSGKWNLNVCPEIFFTSVDVEDYDALAIPGGFEDAGFYEDVFDPRFLRLIDDFDRQEKIIASVCVAALPIGKSGVLAGRNATTYDLPNGERRKQLADFGAKLVNKPIVTDRNIITSAGPANALDVAFLLLGMLTSQNNVCAVKEQMRFVATKNSE